MEHWLVIVVRRPSGTVVRRPSGTLVGYSCKETEWNIGWL